VCRPGGTIALASWMPDSFIGDMFRTIAAQVPPPAGVASPMLWGTESHLRTLFGTRATVALSTVEICTFRCASGAEFVEFFRRWYGPTAVAFASLDEAEGEALAGELAALAQCHDRLGGGRSVAIRATYLQTVLRVAD